MRFGVCIVPHEARGWLPPMYGPKSWHALRDLGITDIRLNAPLPLMQSPPAVKGEPSVFDFAPLHQWDVAMLRLYLNPCGTPPYASEGQPAYVGAVTRWPPHSPETPESYCGTSWWNDPAHPEHGAHFFDQNPARTDTTVDVITGRVIPGAELAAIDAQMPPRPYLVNPPRRDPKAAREAGYALAAHYGLQLDSIGIGNEPGGYDDPVMRQDGAYGGKLGDTIRDRYFPEIVLPFSEGVISSGSEAWIVGPEADSDSVLDRILELEDARYRARPSLSCYDILSIHPYGDLGGGSYATMAAFTKVLDRWKSLRPVRIGEIGGDPQALYDWTVETIAKYQDIESIYYLDPTYFFEPGSFPGTPGNPAPVPSAIGQKFGVLFNSVSSLV